MNLANKSPFSSNSIRSKKVMLLTVVAIALTACGRPVANSSTASTVDTAMEKAVDDPICAEGGTCVVGDTGPGGGKVFYVAPTDFTSIGSACGTSCKYLEAAPTGWITGTTPAGQTNCGTSGTSTADPKCGWSGNTATNIGKTSTALGTGYANTSAMITQSNIAGMAATVARAFQGGGKIDWYLPSKDELNLAFLQKISIGGFTSDFNWSSSEFDGKNAWVQSFLDGFQGLVNKTNSYFVRPVRAF